MSSCPPGDIWQCLETHSVVPTWSGATAVIQRVEAVDAVNSPAARGTALAAKAVWPKMSVVPRLRTPE